MFSIIIPTLGKRPFELKRLLDSLCKQTYSNFEIIMVIQGNHKQLSSILVDYRKSLNIKEVAIDQKGLSNARNIAISHVKGKYITFSDDDCWYPESALQEVKEFISREDVCCFQYFDPILNKYPKKYPNNEMKSLKYWQLGGKSSIELFINLNRVKKEDIVFDNDYGLGSKYPSGEENIFLCDLKRKGYNISYFPRVIAYHAYTLTREISTKDWAIKTKVLNRMYKSKSLALILFALMTFRKKNRKRIQDYPKAFLQGVLCLYTGE